METYMLILILLHWTPTGVGISFETISVAGEEQCNKVGKTFTRAFEQSQHRGASYLCEELK